ncbi:MAG: histidine phosphatase family protein, partial [Parasphingopyxis sp.]|uniref:SixA phosphatase family protein n=1 Tax=Parasphingopyxis sp. TaxID=1920299 RepID=UPI0032EECC62
MKRLILLRHAKSSWDDPVTRDYDRPLNAKGKRAAETMGEQMRGEGLEFDAV